MLRLLILASVVGICANNFLSVAQAVPTPIFYSSLDDDASIGSTGGDEKNNTKYTYVPGAIGNAFKSTSSGTNAGGYANWPDSAVKTIFTDQGWDDSKGITIDQYFLGNWTGISTNPVVNEGLWAIVRRGGTAGGGDNYIFTSVQSGKLRIAFSNGSNAPDPIQYKFVFASPVLQTGDISAGNLALNDNTIYHLTVSLHNSVFKVWLDDVGTNANQYDNTQAKFTDTTTLTTGYNWTLPLAGAVPSGGLLKREMDIGDRGAGVNFGGTLRDGDWVDNVSIYNGEYTPQDLVSTTLAGDYNGDNVVNAADYVVWRKGGSPNPNSQTDYDTWRANFTAPAGSGSSLAPGNIPEPMTLHLCAFAAMVAWIAGRRPRLVR